MLALLLVTSLVDCIEYTVKVPGYSVYCFTSYVAKNVPFHYRASAATNNKYTLTMSLQNGTIVTRKEELAKTKKIDSYSKASFDYRFCIENFDAEPDDFHINFHEGIELTTALLSWGTCRGSRRWRT